MDFFKLSTKILLSKTDMWGFSFKSSLQLSLALAFLIFSQQSINIAQGQYDL